VHSPRTGRESGCSELQSSVRANKEALELDRRGWRDAVETRTLVVKGVGTVERENVQVDVERQPR